MKKWHYHLILAYLTPFSAQATPVISWFFKSQPDIHKIASDLESPGQLAHHAIHGITQHPSVAGICVTYAGYIATSDFNGEVRFPRKNRTDEATIIITTALELVPLFENTMRHWRLIPGNPAEAYQIKMIHDDKTKKDYWQTKKIALPADSIVPLTAIVIIANPSHLMISQENVPTMRTANLLLPAMYVKQGMNIAANTAYCLNIRHLFRPIEDKEQRTPVRLTTHLLD